MPKIREITALINASMQAGNFKSRKFQPGLWSELADLVARIEDDKKVVRPAVFNLDGEGVDVSPNDTYPIQFYHRIFSPLIYPDLSDVNDKSFGDPGHDIEEVAEMVLICIGSTKKLGVYPEEIAPAIVADMPRELTSTQLGVLNLESTIIEITEVNLDSEEVFTQ